MGRRSASAGGRFRRFLPDRQRLHGSRWLRWLGPALHHPRLWHWSRRGVALGVALGIFFGLLIPVAQIPFAAATAVLLRANVAVAVGCTLVTNPITFAPVYVVAHRLGAALLGHANAKAPPKAVVTGTAATRNGPWWEAIVDRLQALGKPLLLGLGILAVAAGLASYAMIMLFWRLKTSWEWRRRRRRIGPGAPAPPEYGVPLRGNRIPDPPDKP